MNLEFIENLKNISQKQLDDAYQAAMYLAFGASAYYLLFGSVMSVSNMIGATLKQPFSQSSRVKLAAISGFIFFSALIKTLYHQHLTSFQPFDSQKYTQKTSALRLIISGVLVGFGSQLAVKGSNDIFSIDGIPSFNLKSILGNIIVIIVGCLTHTYKLYQYLPETPRIIDLDLPENITYTAYLLVFLLIPFICFVISAKKSFKILIAYMSLFAVGIIFGYGLMLGGFTQRKIVYSYMQLDNKWNPDMIIIFGYGLAVSAVVHILMKYGMRKPVFASQLPKDKNPIKLNLLVGSILYGLGWGIGGLRPATVLLLMPLESIKIVFYFGLSCMIGMKISHNLFQQQASVQQKEQKKE